MQSTDSILTILSLLHETAENHSAARQFRSDSVLHWTLRRLRQSVVVTEVSILCWDDQRTSVESIATQLGATILSKGPRQSIPSMDAITVARRWAEGWRGGPLGTSAFDAGFHARFVADSAQAANASAVLIVDPAAVLIDPSLVEAVVAQWKGKPAAEFTFTPAATGLGCILLTRTLVDRLAAVGAHPGRLLHYFPDQLSREPIAADNCAPTPTPVARSPHRFTMSSGRQIARFEAALADMNGSLLDSNAEAIVNQYARQITPNPLPREVVLELTTRRSSKPIFSALGSLTIDRPDLPIQVARRLIGELAALDEARLTLAGVGDPLLHPAVFEIIQYAQERGVSVNVETDLIAADAAKLATAKADLVSIHLPALTSQTYASVMGVDSYVAVLGNVQALVTQRAALKQGTPLVLPLFTKCRQNLAEMEPWYDQWLRAVGSAVIVGPSTFVDLIPDVAVADMAPPLRVPCRRLADRLTVLSDGRFVSCEQDVLGRQSLGRVGQDALSGVWGTKVAALRNRHADGRWKELSVCAACKEWHRP